jgi:hypothetical protein
MIEVCELEGKGKGIVATEFIRAGAVVHRETPLMHLTPSFLQLYRGNTQTGTEKMIAAMGYFSKQMDPDQQERYLSLFGGHIHGPRADNLRRFVQDATFNIKGQPATMIEKEMFVKIVLISNYNAFGDEDESKIYETASRFCHSCEANCTYDFDGPEIIVRSLRPVQAGEELTLDYKGSRRLQPTHVRRFKWLEVKDFTCHCPRCDTPGDDTRQFHCHDPACHGRHVACQPLNKDPLPLPTMVYTGVEYVEPHLLPCTVCHRSPPADYQTAMFDLERRWADVVQELPAIPATPTYFSLLLPDANGCPAYCFEPIGVPNTNAVPAMLKKLKELQYHVPHWTGFQLALNEVYCLMKLSKQGDTAHRPRLLQLATEMEPMLDCFYEPPRERLATFLLDLYAVYNHLGDTASAVRVFRRLIRSQRILHGRDKPCEVEALFRIANAYIGGLPSAAVLAVSLEENCCAYCEESPKRAAMTLSRCGACKKVAYCGAACQKVHWKAHKALCKKG